MNETDDEGSTCCAGVSAGAVHVLGLGGQGSLPRAESWRERWDLERCLRQREWQAGRLRDIKVSAVLSCGQYVIWPGRSPGCGKVMRVGWVHGSVKGCVLGSVSCGDYEENH